MEVHRLGKQSAAENTNTQQKKGPRPVQIVMQHPYAAIKILKSQGKLRKLQETNPLNRVSMKPDYTPQQREYRKSLIAEMEKRKAGGELHLKIRDWKIVQVLPKTK